MRVDGSTNSPRKVSHPTPHELQKGAALAALAFLLIFGSSSTSWIAARATEIPVINGNLGPCTADFTVLDNANKPIYDAKVHVTVRYGFMSKRKTDLEIGTNGEGKARIEGLPSKVKDPPLEFRVSSGEQSKTVTADPALDCHPSFTVALGTP